jgi:hypothetical protein
MVLKLRHPITENQFLQHNPDSVTSLPIEAGVLVKIVGDQLVDVCTAVTDRPVGWLMQKIKDNYTDIPTYARFPSDRGSSDAFTGDPVGVACGRGAIYETNQYTDNGSNGITAGAILYLHTDGTITDNDGGSAIECAIALTSLTASQTSASAFLLIEALL